MGYGAYVPHFRISTAEIAKSWNKKSGAVSSSLGVSQKAVADRDEDCLTMAVEASLQALAVSGIDPQKIGACFVGSESFPYAVKPVGTILAQILGLGSQYFCADLQFACKAGTAGLQVVAAMIEAGMIDYGLAVGSDKSQSRPGDALEYTAGSAAGAYILGRKKSEWLAKLEYTASVSSDTPDFWRRNTQHFPSHAGRFTGEPAYFKHVIDSSEIFLKKTASQPKDFTWAVFHSPNKKFPAKAAKSLGFSSEQTKHSLLVEEIGNPYSASSMVSLANVLDHAKAQDRIFITSYGSGAGSDSFSFRVTSRLAKARKNKPSLTDQLKNTQILNYTEYLNKMEIII